jgi:hypothetical protein
MDLLMKRSVGGRGWRGMLIVLAICSLTVNVATRFWVPSTSPNHTAKSVEQRSVQPKRQHLNKDAARWVASRADFSIIEPVTIEACLAPAGPSLPQHFLSDSLYNRPPPSSEFLL